VKPENLPAKIFLHPPLKWQGKTSNFANLPPTRRHSEACNFKTAEHIDKQKQNVLSAINMLKRYQTWGITPRGFDASYGKNC